MFGVPTIILAWLLLYILQKNGRTYFPTNKTHFIIRFLGMILKVRIYTCYISGLYTYMIIYGYIYILYHIRLWKEPSDIALPGHLLLSE